MSEDVPSQDPALPLSAFRESQSRAYEALKGALDNDRMHHAYLLVGRQLTESKNLARSWAARLICESPSDADACGLCAPCRKLSGNNHPDVLWVAPNEKGKITIDAVRGVSERLSLRASEAKVKVVVVESADQMNRAAQNALLKTLEEPPGPTCFILTVSRYRAMLPTVRSRSQTIRLRAESPEEAIERLRAAGYPDPLCEPVSRLIGGDVERANLWLEMGLEEVHESIGESLREAKGRLAPLLDLAADLGRDKDRGALGLALFELRIRDALAKAAMESSSASRRQALVKTAERIMELRRLAPFNLNRTLAFERLLLTRS